MSEIDPEYVKHQYLYVPWTDKFDSFGVGKALARHVANHFRARLTVVCPQKSNAQWHDELAKLPIVTERTGTVVDGGVVLAFVPTRKVMAKVHHLSKSIVIMVEDPSERFEAWARMVGAYNVLTRKVMSSGLSEAGTKALNGVVSEGYNGWHDSIAETMTIKHLRDLAESDGYDRAIVLEYAAQRKGEYALKRLEKILDTFERSVLAVA
jgi:hypothetical protein